MNILNAATSKEFGLDRFDRQLVMVALVLISFGLVMVASTNVHRRTSFVWSVALWII